MKYESNLLETFKRLGFEPRSGQLAVCNQILEAFLDAKMKNVILNASTGAGKSIIGAAVADTISVIKRRNPELTKSSISLTATNVLAQQYESTFGGLSKSYIVLKGANNYSCSALSTQGEDTTADACAWFTMVQNGSEFKEVLDSHCSNCEYLHIKQQKNTVRHLTTNYSYYFIDRMYTGKFEDRDLIVWDEAHLINDLFSEHNAIHFSQKRVQQMAQEIADTIQITDIEIAKTLKTVAEDCGKGKITEHNYRAYMNAMLTVYRYAKTRGVIQQEQAIRGGKHSSYVKLTRFIKKYEGLACKIDDFVKYGYDHVFEYKDDEKAVSIKPVFVGAMMEALECAEHNLFMSATVSSEFMTKTLGLDEELTVFIKAPPTFPKENKEIVFFDPMSLNYTSLKDPKTISQLRKNVSKIVKKHIGDGDRGIILTPSFKLTQEISDEVRSIKGYVLFEHIQGEKLEHVLTAFKKHKGPAVLISPSLYEGVDLPGDQSRFQVLVKAPYPSLGDKRMKFILDNYPSLYNTIAIMKIIQGAGRSVRSMDDHATTYILDMNAQRLFTSPLNIWKDEFTQRFTKFI